MHYHCATGDINLQIVHNKDSQLVSVQELHSPSDDALWQNAAQGRSSKLLQNWCNSAADLDECSSHSLHYKHTRLFVLAAV